MHRINAAETAAAHRIFNRVEDAIGPYYGRKTVAQARDYVSENRWIMFPQHGITSLREGAELPVPNMFVSVGGENIEIKDNGAGAIDGNLGVTYHNVEAMLGLRQILKRKSHSDLLINMLKSLGDEWSVEIQRKTQTDCPDSTPHYETYRAYKPSALTADGLAQALKDSDRTLRCKGDTYPPTGTDILWEVSIFVVWKDTETATFERDAKKSFDVLLKMMTIR
jgi:hypothetical protein